LKVEKQTLENHRAKIIVDVEPEQIEKASSVLPGTLQAA